MDSNTIIAWVGIVLSGISTLIVVPLGVYIARYRWDRSRWLWYRELIHAWLEEEFFPEDMTEDDWRALAAIALSEAGFEPMRMKELIELAVWYAKGRTRKVLRGQIAEGRKDSKHDQPELG